MEMPKPTDAHRKLNALAGRWIGKEVMPTHERVRSQRWATLEARRLTF